MKKIYYALPGDQEISDKNLDSKVFFLKRLGLNWDDKKNSFELPTANLTQIYSI